MCAKIYGQKENQFSMKLLEKIRLDWQRDKVLFFMEYIGYLIILSCNIWVLTRPLPVAEIAFWWLIMNLIGFFIGASIIQPILLHTVFKERFKSLIDKIIEKVKNV